MSIGTTGGLEPTDGEGRAEFQDSRDAAAGSDDEVQSCASSVSRATQSSMTSQELSTGSEDLPSSPSSNQSLISSPDIDAFLGPQCAPPPGVLPTFKLT